MTHIEPYKAGGRRYYRAVTPYEKIHLGSAEAIIAKVRPDKASGLARRNKTPDNPPNIPDGALSESPEDGDYAVDPGLLDDEKGR